MIMNNISFKHTTVSYSFIYLNVKGTLMFKQNNQEFDDLKLFETVENTAYVKPQGPVKHNTSACAILPP